ncbi:MAG: hypothetical protein AAFR67_04335, partial [Chloroflexota bacterium]
VYKVQTADSESNNIIIYDNRGQQTGAITINDTARRRMYWSPQDAYLMLSSSFDDAPTLILSAQAQAILELQSPAIWHPSENWVLEGDDETPLALWDIESGEALLSATTTLIPPVFSPNGDCFLYQPDESTIATMNVSTGETKLRSISFTSQISNVVWHPDSTHVAIRSYDNQMTLWHVHTDRVVDVYNVTSTPVWHTENYQISAGYDYTRLRVWDATSGETLHSWDGFDAPVSVINWEANWLQSISREEFLGLRRETQVFDTDTGQEILRVQLGDYLSHASIENNRLTLVVLCSDVNQYDLESGNSLPTLTIPLLSCISYMNPTGELLVFVNTQERFQMMYIDQPEITYNLPANDFRNIYQHPDGDLFAYIDAENTLYVVQVDRLR